MRKRLCFITTVPYVVKFFLRDILESLSRHHDIVVVVNNDGSLARGDLPDGVELLHVPIERKISVWRDITALYQLVRILRGRQFDAVHTLAPKAGLLGILAGKIVGIRVRIHTFQGEVWVTKRGLWRHILILADQVVAWLATHLTVVSKSEMDS